MPNKQDIILFLQRVKDHIKNKRYDFINRDKRELTRLGISFAEAVYIVEHLQIENYYRGPKEDHNGSGNLIYEFGYFIEETELYIKLTLRQKDELFIMSFHEAKRKIKYPFKT